MYLELRNTLKRMFYRKPGVWKILEFFQGILYVFNYWFYYSGFWKKTSSLKEINLEFSSICNLRCKWCSLDHQKPKKFMTQEMLRRFFESFLSDARFRRVKVINLHNGGETLLHPEIVDMLAIVRGYKARALKAKQPFPDIYLLTNGTVLSPALSKKILDLDVVDVMQFSVDGGTPERFEAIRRKARWHTFYQNVMTFCRLNKEAGSPVRTRSISIIEDDFPLHDEWMHPEFRKLIEQMDDSEFRRAHNWAGEVEIPSGIREKRHKIGCSFLMHQLVVLADGNASVCCNDLNARCVLGNIMTDNLFSLYQSPKRLGMLKLFLKRKKSQIPLCRDCETF